MRESWLSLVREEKAAEKPKEEKAAETEEAKKKREVDEKKSCQAEEA